MPDPMLQALQASILRICELKPEGISDVDILAQLGTDVKPRLRSSAYNELLKAGRLRLASKFIGPEGQKKKTVVYQWVSAGDAEKFKGLDASEVMTYDLIQKAGHNGVTKREIKYKTNIQNTTELKQIVDRLLSRALIKEIKSVQGTNKKVYIVSELEPSTLHTGGPWYNDEQEFDNEFIEVIYGQVLSYVKSLDFVTVEQVTNYVAEIKVSNEELSQKDIRALMMTMLYDTVIEECQGEGREGEYFRHVLSTPAVNHLSPVPCGSCPLFHDCTPGGVISPQTCVYMTEWLKETTDW